MHRILIFLTIFLLLTGCGKKAPPQAPPEVGKVYTTMKTNKRQILVGKGGYFVGDDGYIALYWSFPIKVDYSIILLGKKRITTTKGWNYIYPHLLEKGKTYTFKVVGIKGNNPVAEAVIEVSP